MVHSSRYIVVGQGRWGSQVSNILKKCGCKTSACPISRPGKDENLESYREKAHAIFKKAASNADIVWLAIPPPNQALLADAALDAGLHVVAEKPWTSPQAISKQLAIKAQAKGLLFGVHYQYCLLNSAQLLSAKLHGPEDVAQSFSGRFTISKKNRLGLSALENLGSHLLAIRQFHFPKSSLGQIVVAYDAKNCRYFELKTPKKTHRVNFLDCKQPLVQEFISMFEECLNTEKDFPLNLQFAQLVQQDMQKVLKSSSILP